MGIITTNANVVTGSATNTLGTLGRSIFNSTIGTFADKDAMNQIYDVMGKLTSSIETVDKTIDLEAFNGRNKADDLFSLLAGLDIKSSSDFMNKNREFMKRLMRLNKQEKDITLDAIGVDVTGESDIVRNEYVRDYEHVQGNNYYEEYVKTLPQNQQIGDETTTLQLESSTNFNYAGIHNDLYVVNQNLYPDDENRGTFSNKWLVENRNSLLYKTKKLFNSKKINTIISRFHTDPNRRPSLLDNAKSKYGLSHGRNLLTKKAEDSLNSAYANGYDNPYCRVWTHHHQYDRYYKTIRPFSHVDDQGDYTDTMSPEEFHQWGQFSNSKDTNSETHNKWGWKKEDNNGWKHSVLQKNGLVNITPKYVKGESSNIHTKQCMFSIENLAWRGYDPYSFEQALSWEQRGPLGGRIMWFPPYGIQFNETTTTQWQNNTFLGRGEDVYTYANTTRTGSLSFMMVVDHPSILDYVTWTEKNNNNVSDTDILRFFAGCGEGDGKGLRDFATPTPLTDEYTQIHDEKLAGEEFEPDKKETVIEEENETTPDEEKVNNNILCFYVFYPNNYSGTYDDPSGEFGSKSDINTKVEPIPYLIAGTGAQKTDGKLETDFKNDKELTDAKDDGWDGNGYEMNVDGNGLGNGGSYISGTSMYPNSKDTKTGKRRYWTGLNSKNRSGKYAIGLKDASKCKKWYYRIDGRYVWPQDSAIEEKSHYYNQTLKNASSYVDEKSFGLNNNIEVLARIMDDQIQKNEDGNYCLKTNNESEVYTLAEVAYVLYDGNEKKQEKCRIDINNEEQKKRIDALKEKLNEEKIKEIKSISAAGYASAQGYVDTNHKLGEHRAQTAANWFIKTLNLSNTPDVGYEPSDGNNIGEKSDKDTTIDDRVSGDESEQNAKKWRYARVEISFTSASTTTPAKSNDTYQESKEEEVETSGFDFDTGVETPIKTENIIPTPSIASKDSLKIKRIELVKVSDNEYKFKITDDKDKVTEYKSLNCMESHQKGDSIKCKDNISAEPLECPLIRRFSFTYVIKKDDKEEELPCVVYDYNYVFSIAMEDYENYYYIDKNNAAPSIKYTFCDPKPVERDDEVYYHSTNPDVEIKEIEYDANQKTLKITPPIGQSKTVNVTKSYQEEDFRDLWLEDGGRLTISNEVSFSATGESIVGITVLQATNVTPLIDTNGYYLKKKDKPKIDNVVLSVTKNEELINIEELSEFGNKPMLTMKFKEPVYDRDMPINEAYGNVVYDVLNENGYNLGNGKYSIQTPLNGTFNIEISGSDDNKNVKVTRDSKIGVDGKELKKIDITIFGLTVKENPPTVKESKAKSARMLLSVNSEDSKTTEPQANDNGGSSSSSMTQGGVTTETKKTVENDKKEAKPNVDANREKKYIGYKFTGQKGDYKGVTYPIYEDSKRKRWYKITDKDSKIAKFISVGYASEVDNVPIARFGGGNGDENRLRYDQEYHFFKVLQQTDPVVFGSLMDKLKYFDPAFHSMTPEGFNGRLTFLQQCMRQGNTVSASDGKNAKSANNLAFGRAPYCVLRLGDFYNQLIVIDNLSINYDPLVWDLNVEGVGVQPLIAHVQLSFKFVGGGDMTGPVRRLQNAMSFNYYANARLYDNRADRIERKWSDKTNGAIEHDEILNDNMKKASENEKKKYNMNETSSFYTTKMYQ